MFGNMFKEFRDFAMRGNVLDLAVGIVIGTAFGAIVSSLVSDIIMPPIGVLLGGVDFSQIVITLKEAQGEDPAVTINIGTFINTLINFVIVALAMFMVIQAFNRLKRKPEEKPADPTTKACPYCLTEINLKATRCPNCTSELASGKAV